MASASDVLIALLGAGGAGSLAILAKGIKEWRAGSWIRQDKAVNNLHEWFDEVDNEREWQALQHSWWRDWGSRLEYELTSRGLPLPKKERYPSKPKPQSDKERKK